MIGIPVIAGGAAVDCKPSVIVGGAGVPIYDGYVIQGGQAVKIFQSADCQGQNVFGHQVLFSDGSFSASWMTSDNYNADLFKLVFNEPITFAVNQTICTISSFLTCTYSIINEMIIKDEAGNYVANNMFQYAPTPYPLKCKVATTSKEFTFAVSQDVVGGNASLSWAAGALAFNGIQLNNIDILG